MKRPPTRTASQRLAAAVSRLGRVIRADPGHNPEAPEPKTDWEQQTDARLSRIEQTVANQNRLLLLSLVAIIGDAVIKLATR